MTTVPHSHPDYKPTQQDHLLQLALIEASRRAFAAYPANERVFKAAQLALAGKVTLLDHGAEVASQFGTTTYAINGTCACPDKRREQAGHCKHEYAAAILRKAFRLLHEAQAKNIEDTDGPPCPQCQHRCVVVEGSRRGTYRICRYRLELGQVTWECGWKAAA